VILRSAIDALAAVLFPAPCRICATTLLTASRIPICDQCFASFEPIRNPICLCCGRPFLIRTDMAVEPEQLELGASAQTHCRQCRVQFFKFELARSFGAYNETLKKAILLLKFEEVTRLGDWFASRLAEVVSREAESFRADVVPTASGSGATTKQSSSHVPWPENCISNMEPIC
jgi:predicted amidophosphoribosyltransferase